MGKAWLQTLTQVLRPSLPRSGSILCCKGPSSARVWTLQSVCPRYLVATLRSQVGLRKEDHTDPESELRAIWVRNLCAWLPEHSLRLELQLSTSQRPLILLTQCLVEWPEDNRARGSKVLGPEQEALLPGSEGGPSIGPAHSGTMQPDELPNYPKEPVKRKLTATDTCCFVNLVPGTGL